MSRLSLVRNPHHATRKPDGHAPRFIATPAVFEQIQREVAYAAETGSHLRVAGRGHTRAPLCRCDDGLLQLSRFTGIEDVDAVHGIAWVRSGTRLSQLARELASYGLALPTLGWSGNESVGGAVSIGSYGLGTGDSRYRCPVVGLRMIGADGSAFSIGANDPRLPLARVSLGTLGVLTHVGLRCIAASHLQSRVTGRSLNAVISRVNTLRAHDYVEWYWTAHSDDVRLRTIDRRPRHAPGRHRHALKSGSARLRSAVHRAIDVMPQFGGRLPWRLIPERARIPESVDAAYGWQLFSESNLGTIGYALPIDALGDTLHALRGVLRAIDPNQRVVLRVRYACADDAALSPAYGNETAFVRILSGPKVRDHAEAAGDIFERHGARPLWIMPHEHHLRDLETMYPLWNAFAQLRAELDPRGLFLNDYLAGIFGVEEAS